MSHPKWVRERRLMEVTGLSKDQVKHRRQQWAEGKQWKEAPDGCIWYNLEEIDRWVEQDRVA